MKDLTDFTEDVARGSEPAVVRPRPSEAAPAADGDEPWSPTTLRESSPVEDDGSESVAPVVPADDAVDQAVDAAGAGEVIEAEGTAADGDEADPAEAVSTDEGASEPGEDRIEIPLSTESERPPDDLDDPGWHQLDNGRWVVGDAGRQREIVELPSTLVQGRSDLALDWSAVGAVTYRSASMRGLGHFADGKPRQDACLLSFTPDRRWLVGCVADGVSSGKLSHVAADIAVETITKALASEIHRRAGADSDAPVDLRELGWQEAIDAASRLIADTAKEQFLEAYRKRGETDQADRLSQTELPYKDAAQFMATTAVAFVVGTERAADGTVPFALVVAAGDSSALVLSQDTWHPITHVKNSENDVASSAVRPLPREVVATLVHGVLHGGQALAVITDGVGDPLGSGTGVVGRFLAQRWRIPPDPLSFANDMAFYRRTFVDDRTAAVVWLAPSD